MTSRHVIAGVLFAAVTMCGVAFGQTVTVDTSSDVVDFGGAQMVGDLPGPDGQVSLREAGLASDNTPGIQTIAFAVPQSDWQHQWLYPGRVVLTPFLGFRVFDTAIIDATTQTDFTGETNPDGGEVVIWNTASGDDLFLINSVGGEVRGFDNTAIVVSGGSDNIVRGNTMTNITVSSSFSLIGGTAPGEGNTGGTLKIDRANDVIVVGNTIQRVRVLGFGAAQPAVGNRIGGPDLEDRNFITGYGYVNGEGLPGGTTVQLFDTVDTLVENNWIGTTPDGLAQGSLSSSVGIGFEGENHDTVIRNNRIAGILGHGQNPHHAGQVFGWAILVGGAGSNVTIVGNTIGLDANDAPTLGSVWGVDVGNVITSPSTIDGIRIGGDLPGEGNVIAGHILNGITIGHDVPQVRISGNAIYDNGWLGIDLIPTGFGYGVTPNDPLDADTGGNGLQNFPEIDTVTRLGSTIRVVGSLHSAPARDYGIEFFASPECDASGFGEGQVFLGSASVTTDSAGNAGLDVSLSTSVPEGWWVTSTATLEPEGATSEFSACVGATGTADPAVEPIMGLLFDSTAGIDWSAAPSATGYDVMRGDLSDLRWNESVGDATCGWEDHPSTSLVDSEAPAPGTGFYYMIRGDAEQRTAGTLDNPPGMSMPSEGRDEEVGTAGGSACADSP